MNELEQRMYDGALSQYAKICELEAGTEEQSRAINGAGNIMDRINESRKLRIEEEKLEIEKEKNRIEESKVKADERDKKRKDYIEIGVKTVALTVIGLAVVFTTGVELGNTKCMNIAKVAERKLLDFFSLRG